MRRFARSIYGYMAAGLLIATAAIVIISGFAAQRQNTQSLETQKVVARHQSDDAFAKLQGQLTQMIFWQDAYDNVVRRWNQTWISYQFGPYLESTGLHLVAIYGPDGTLRFLHSGGPSGHVTDAMLAKADGLHTLLGSFKAAVMRPPLVRRGMTIIGGRPYFAVAAPITPEHAADLAEAGRRPFTVVFFAPATVASFHALTEGFAAKDLRITRGGVLPDGYAALPLNDAAGNPLAWLTWQPRRPGADFLEIALPAIAVVFLLLALLQWAVVRYWQSMQRDLFRAQAQAFAACEESRIKSAFLGTISHELRTPLNAIIGFSDVLLNRDSGPHEPSRVEEYVGHIRASGAAVLKIINDLIEIARIEARETGAEHTCIDAAECARLAVDNARQAARAQKVALVLDAEEGIAWCEGSSPSLCQATERILDNAIRHSKPGTRVVVSARRDERGVAVIVCDQGDGIPPERLEALGKPFGHTESHLVTGRGVGLGLSISTGLMRVMGGSLEIESEEGVGTTVTLRLKPSAPPETLQTKAA